MGVEHVSVTLLRNVLDGRQAFLNENPEKSLRFNLRTLVVAAPKIGCIGALLELILLLIRQQPNLQLISLDYHSKKYEMSAEEIRVVNEKVEQHQEVLNS